MGKNVLTAIENGDINPNEDSAFGVKVKVPTRDKYSNSGSALNLSQ